jgi:Tol biopolymer transport system component
LRTPGSHLWMSDLEADRVWPLTRAADSESYPSASRQGDQIVFTQGEPNYNVVEIALGDPGPTGIRRLLRTTRNESDAEVSRDGKALIYVTDQTGQDEIWLKSRVGQAGDKPLVTQTDFGDDFTLMLASPSLSPLGDRVAYLRNGLNPRFLLRVWISTVEGALRTPLLPREYEAMQGAPTWSSDGQFIAYPEWKANRWNLMTMRVDGQGQPVTIRTDGVANATPHWSPDGKWITWETQHGFVLVSPDGSREQPLTGNNDIWSDTPWLVHAWSADSQQIFGIKMTDDRRLTLVAVQVASKRTRELRDLGRSPIVNNPVKGFSVSQDGRTFTTSLAQLPGDIWVLRGLDYQAKPWWRR